ncbi:MAG: host-nuclease inhibitor Gam family protein [Robiginitomaculum sp.]|nr:host-nuclease inhibitor Gam family protein [Robiginitomaculum sp.]
MVRKAQKISVDAPQDMSEADQHLREIGRVNIQLRDIDTDLRESTQKMKQQAEDQAKPLRLQKEALELGLQSWAQANRKALTNDNRTKTVKLPSGEIKWRILPAKVTLRKVQDIIAYLKANKLRKFLRVKLEIDKDAMLRDKIAAAKVPGVTIGSDGEAIDFSVDETKLAA